MNGPTTREVPTRPVLRWHGGKWRIAPWIIGHFPPHDIYVEPFGGAASVLLQKPRAASELYNDLDGDIVNLFRVLRDRESADRLRLGLELTPWAREEFASSREPAADDIERARRFVVQIMMGYGSAGRRKSPPGFRARTYCGSMTGAPDWRNYPEALPAITERFQGVIIENGDALELLSREDSPDALFYADPPYLPATRSAMSTGMYAHEMDRDAHTALLERLRGLKGMVVLSGYGSDLYDESLADWRRVTTAAIADGAEQRTEVLWVNPRACAALDRASDQADMFSAPRATFSEIWKEPYWNEDGSEPLKPLNCRIAKGRSMMTRQQHLEWCKKRAHEYLARGDTVNAVASMMSDLEKHPDTAVRSPALNMLGMMAAQSGNAAEVRRYIDGFN